VFVENEPIRILLVEDNPGDVMLLEHNLWQVHELKFKLTHVAQMGGLGKALEADSFDILMLDLNLPDSRGLDTVSRAMKQAPWMPIVVLTSVDNEGAGMDAVRLGAQDYLVKGEVDGWLLARTIRYAIERKRAQRDLECSITLAGEAQRALLPLKCPPGWGQFAATARNRMCGSVGGDFYDFTRINAEQVSVCIGDVMGHDVRAALLMAQILGFLRFEQRNRTIQIVSDLNRTLLALGDKVGTALTCSLFYMILDAPSGGAFFVSAGHPPAYLYDPQTGKTDRLASGEILLGIERFQAVEMCHTMGPGSRMVLYTDGILEASSAAGEPFGSQRLEEAIRRHAADGQDACADGIMAEVSEFRQGAAQVDDESVVIVDRL
jgi:CheY-like chemotaxis protein